MIFCVFWLVFVVFSHCCDPFTAAFDSGRDSFLWGVFLGSIVRCSVPLFVMMSGVLLLPNDMDMSQFYKKRLGRIILPIIFWSAALPLMFLAYLHLFDTTSPVINESEFSLSTAIRKIFTSVFNFNYDTTPLWYIYMLAGLYLFMPVINTWLKHSTKKDIEIFLGVWFFTLFIPYIKMAAPFLGYAGNYGNMGIFGVCDWNDYGTFYYFSGFLGYLVLAYYLAKYPVRWSLSRTIVYTLPVFLLAYLITSFGFVAMQELYPGNYAYLEIIWYFAGINVFMMTLPVFLIVQKLPFQPHKWLRSLAALTFGIYLCHFFFVQVGYDLFSMFDRLPIAARIAADSIFAFSISALLVRLMSSVRQLKVFVN